MKGSVPDECDGVAQVVKFHKRGVPHLHMLTPAKEFLRNYERPAKGLRNKLGKVKVTQFPVNCNIATTGHKLQGISKYTLIISS